MMDGANDNLAGTELGAYRLLRRLGAGGMGVVYLAHDRTLNRAAALKVLSPRYAADPAWLARFHREARAAARLSHPNIVQVYAMDMNGSPPYIAMEFIDGTPLDKLLGANEKLPWQQAMNLCGQVASALECAHTHGVVHRDIKPANILVDKHGRAHVTDFGVAKMLEAATRLTSLGALVGTPQYMSPEQFGAGEVGPASDLFSLGTMTFEMLSGKPPFHAHTPAELVKKIAFEPLDLTAMDLADVPQSVRHMVSGLLEKDLRRRYASATSVLLDLQLIRSNQSITHVTAPSTAVDLKHSLVEELLDGANVITASKPLRGASGQGRRHFVLGGALIAFIAMVGAGISALVEPASETAKPQAENGMGRLTLQEACDSNGIDAEGALALLEARGIAALPTDTMYTIAERVELTPPRLLLLIGPQAGAPDTGATAPAVFPPPGPVFSHQTSARGEAFRIPPRLGAPAGTAHPKGTAPRAGMGPGQGRGAGRGRQQ